MTIELILGGILTGIVVAALGWLRGRSSGKKAATDAEKVKDYERVKDNIQKRETADHDARSGSSAADRLRDEFGRD